MANNLELQGGVYHVRLAIPKDVQNAFGGKKILSQSLKTGLRSEAMDRRLPILSEWKQRIQAARKGNMPPEDWQEQFVSAIEKVDTFRTNKRRALIGEDVPPFPPSKAIKAMQLMVDNPEFLKSMISLVEKSRAMEKNDGLAGALKFQDLFAHALKTSLPTLHKTLYTMTEDHQAEMTAFLADPASIKPKSVITKKALAAFRTYRQSRGADAKNIAMQEMRLTSLSDFLAKHQRPLDFDSVSAWLDSLGLSTKTLNQYRLAGSVFWKWAMKHDSHWREHYRDKASPFDDHDLPQTRGNARNDGERKDFTLAELSKLHAAALNDGHTALADLILLGTYTGARIEELCRLQIENVITVEGVQSFDIVESKTKAGIRVVPIHPALKGVVARLIDDSTDGYLVPTKGRNKYQIRSDALGKAFGRLKTAQGFGPQHVFHSIRKTVITQLVRADVTGTLIAELVGHETGTVTFDIYSQGASAKQKFEAISKLPKIANSPTQPAQNN
ncbi:tyrosine-type recombinase/integrase [Pseudomonas sp. VS40]|uniref:tyrosine-type recombinase/integrase n=1 Tax=unclassified Pseudomonas TaxID=196821 RepID=UPI001BDDFB62|nr:tyrosine-type recombinase/integrase [Pseudomonas sp. VS40]MBT1271433.1 tyrosine-type recombinase/integrase [Pseudomonas sp. VS59]